MDHSRAFEDCQLYKKSPQAFSFSYRRNSQGTLTGSLVKSVYHKKSVYGSQFMITFALTWGSLRLTLNCLMMLLP